MSLLQLSYLGQVPKNNTVINIVHNIVKSCYVVIINIDLSLFICEWKFSCCFFLAFLVNSYFINIILNWHRELFISCDMNLTDDH